MTLDHGLLFADEEYFSVSTIKNEENIIEALNEDVKAWSLLEFYLDPRETPPNLRCGGFRRTSEGKRASN